MVLVKPCTKKLHIFILDSCVLGKREHNCLVIRVCLWSKVKIFCMIEAVFEKEWACLRHLIISNKVISVGHTHLLPKCRFCWISSLIES